MKESFLMFVDNFDAIEELTDEQKGILLQAIVTYVRSGELIKLPQLIKVIFIPIKNSIDRNNKKYEEEIEQRRAAGRLGGQARARNAKQTQAPLSDTKQVKQIQANQGDSVPVPVPVPVYSETDEKKAKKSKGMQSAAELLSQPP